MFTGPTVQLGDPENPPSPEQIHANWDKINSLEGGQEIEDANTAIFALITPTATDTAEAKTGDEGAGDGKTF